VTFESIYPDHAQAIHTAMVNITVFLAGERKKTDTSRIISTTALSALAVEVSDPPVK